MAMAKSTVDVKILIDEREIITGPSGPVIRDIEQVPSGYRFALREIDETVQPGEEKVIKRQIGQGVKTIEAAKAKALKTKPPKATRRQRDVLDGAPNSKPRKQNRRNNGIDQAVELLFRNGIKPAYRNEVDKVLVDLVKKASA